MTADDVIAMIKKALRAETVTLESGMGSLRNWDSLSQIHVMMALEQEMGAEVPAELFGELTSVAAIVAFLEEEGLLRR